MGEARDHLFYYCYVLFSERDHKLYIGYSANLQRRIKEHLGGGVISTRNRRPLQLIYYEAFLSKEDAQRREQYLKTTAGKKGLKLILRKTLKELDYKTS
jgi:putative endonuclease